MPEIRDVPVLALKKDTPKLVAIPICRSCFLRNSLESHAHMPYPHASCAAKGCENEAAYMVTLTPFQFTE